jgi:tripartite-type tricarboxylate transporter receptor subunit TctC
MTSRRAAHIVFLAHSRRHPGVLNYASSGAGSIGHLKVERLNSQVRAALAQPDMSRRLIDLGGEPQAGSVEEINRFVATELRKWQGVIDSRKIERQ